MPTRKPVTADQVVRLFDAEMSPPDIAKTLEVSLATVRRRLKEAGRPPGRTPTEAAALRTAQGKSRTWGDHWRGKRRPLELVEKTVQGITGSVNGRWKHGRCSRAYRKAVAKERCSECGRKDSLAIHHRDFDHYNNAEENLEVLCVSCHLGLHKREYWRAKREGREPQRSNGPCHWPERPPL